MIYSDNTYDITNNIATYTRRDFKSVFDTTSNKWYMLNNLNNYEEYGIYGDSFDTYYTGKLVIMNGHEYEWNGTEWVDLGEFVERVDGWTNTNDTRSFFSIKYNGSNYVLKATKNDVEFTIFCLQNVPKSQDINMFDSASRGDFDEYELFYAGSVEKMIFDLGYFRDRRIEVNYTWNANTEYVIRGTNGNYLDTTSNMKLFINGVLLGSKGLATYDNTSDKISMNYQSQYKYNKEFKIYESTGLLFDIKCKEDNGQYILYDALGNGELYNYGTEDPVVVTPIMTFQRPKDYDTKKAPTISTLFTSTIYRNSGHLTTLMRNDTEQAIWNYMEDDILKKGEYINLNQIQSIYRDPSHTGNIKFPQYIRNISSFSATFKFTQSGGGVFLGSNGSSDSNDWRMFFHQGEIYYDCGNGRTNNSQIKINNTYNLLFSGNPMKLTNITTGAVIYTGSTTRPSSGDYNFCFGAIDEYGGGGGSSTDYGYLYDLVFYSDNEGQNAIAHYIPYIQNDTVGMYDKINNVFVPANGTIGAEKSAS